MERVAIRVAPYRCDACGRRMFAGVLCDVGVNVHMYCSRRCERLHAVAIGRMLSASERFLRGMRDWLVGGSYPGG